MNSFLGPFQNFGLLPRHDFFVDIILRLVKEVSLLLDDHRH